MKNISALYETHAHLRRNTTNIQARSPKRLIFLNADCLQPKKTLFDYLQPTVAQFIKFPLICLNSSTEQVTDALCEDKIDSFKIYYFRNNAKCRLTQKWIVLRDIFA